MAERPALSERKTPRMGAYLLIVALIASLIAGLAAQSILQERDRYRERAVVATQNISALLEQHINDVFEEIDLNVRSSAYYVEEMLASGRVDKARLNRFLAHQKSLTPDLDSLRIAGPDGLVIYGLNQVLPEPVSVAEREYFTAARDSLDGRVIVQGPVFAKISQKWVIVFARRLSRPDGSFAGVVYANLPTASFERVFSGVKLGPHGAATIRGTDMALVHRVPDTKNAVGSRNVSKQLSEVVAQAPDGGVYLAATALDGIERMNAYRRLKAHPFYVIVGLATDDYLGGWKRNLYVVSGLAVFGVLVAALAALMAYRSQRRLQSELLQKTQLALDLEAAVRERSALNAELEVRIREAQAATRAKNAFLSNVSHELNTPLHQISGMANLISKQPLSDRQLDWLGKLQAASSHMASLVNHVLEFTRLDADGFELSRVPVNVHALAEKVQRRWLPQACARAQQISLDIEPLADPLSGDAQLLEKALDHYVHNAIKFADEGMIVISVRLLERDMNSVLLKFAVSDAGPGLDSAVVQRLFNAFALQDETTTRVQGGVGLGLVTVRKLARLMGGDAGCDSQAGQGSAFWFTVRLHRA